MKKLFLILGIFLFVMDNVKAFTISKTIFSYSNIGNDYSFYFNSFFTYGEGVNVPILKWHFEHKTSDTLYISGLYDARGAWSFLGGGRDDTVKYTNPYIGINYINVSSAILNGSAAPSPDTTWNIHDTTFDLNATNIRDIANMQSSFSVFPNPANNVLQIANTKQNKWSEAEVYNLYGQLQLRQSHNASINIQQLSSGMYFLVLKDEYENNIGTAKFIKR